MQLHALETVGDMNVTSNLVLQRKVAAGKLQNLAYRLVRTAFWTRICKTCSDFQSKIDANPLDSYPIFAEISLLHSCRWLLSPQGKTCLFGTFYSTLCAVILETAPIQLFNNGVSGDDIPGTSPRTY